MNTIEVLEKVHAHLVKQGVRSIDVDQNICLYLRESDGARCAVGLFIPDGHRALGERCSVSNLMEDYPDLAYGALDVEGLDADGLETFWSTVQQFHDGPHYWTVEGDVSRYDGPSVAEMGRQVRNALAGDE